MADNVTLEAGLADGAVIATDDISSVHYQRVKLIHGADNSNDGDVSTSNGLPVDVLDDATRDLGKVDVALLDQYTPIDVDTGGGTENALPVTLRIGASGGSVAQTYGAGNSDAGTQRVVVATDQATVAVDGNVSHDAADSGDPVKIGGVARTANPTAVANGDRVDAYCDDNGRDS